MLARNRALVKIQPRLCGNKYESNADRSLKLAKSEDKRAIGKSQIYKFYANNDEISPPPPPQKSRYFVLL